MVQAVWTRQNRSCALYERCQPLPFEVRDEAFGLCGGGMVERQAAMAPGAGLEQLGFRVAGGSDGRARVLMESMKLENYWIVTGDGPEELCAEVLRRINEGWQSLGSLQIVGGRWCQVMVKLVPKVPGPHDGMVYYRSSGKRGTWMTPEEAAAARESEC